MVLVMAKTIEARCMRCRKQVEIKDGKKSILKNGLEAIRGVCPICNTKVCRILGKVKEGEQ